jgi:FkbM family methyltransferase
MHWFYDDEATFRKLRGTVLGRDIKTVLDVGAAIGYYSIMYAAWPSAKVYAIEPSTINYADLTPNIAPFKNIVPIKVAALDRAGGVEIALPKPTTKEYRHSPENPGQISIHGDSSLFREVVPAKPLDDMFETADYIKTDTEGADLLVLKGAERLLREARPVLQIEMMVHNFRLGKYDMEELVDYLIELEYKPVGQWGVDFIFRPVERLTATERTMPVKIVEGKNAYRLKRADSPN